MQDTKLTRGFWTQRVALAGNRMLPAMEKTMLGLGTANLNRIKWAAGLIDEAQHGSPWGDGDNYKWIEAMAHLYNLTKAPHLDAKMDEWIAIIGEAQEPDGYISTNVPRRQKEASRRRRSRKRLRRIPRRY